MQNDDTSSEKRTQAEALKLVNSLLNPKDPKSNLWAICIICNSDGITGMAANGLGGIPPLKVVEYVQGCIDQLKEDFQKTN